MVKPRFRRPTSAEIERDPDFRAAMAIMEMSKEQIALALARDGDDDPDRDERTCWDRFPAP